MDVKLDQLCLSVCEIARLAGKMIADERKRFDDSRVEYKGLHDLVSYVDKNSEKLVVSRLETLLPEAGFLTEEGTESKKGEKYSWIIDPLDGTTNFVQGVPVFAVSIGLQEKDEIVLGVVYEIGRDECFYAWKGGGAFLNGNNIHVSERDNIQDALLATGFPYSEFSRLDRYMEFLKWVVINSRGVRRLGSAATDLAYVACGRFEAFWEYNLKPWDVAAGSIIVQEAGGKITDFAGKNNFLFGKEIVATNQKVQQLFLDKLKEIMG